MLFILYSGKIGVLAMSQMCSCSKNGSERNSEENFILIRNNGFQYKKNFFAFIIPLFFYHWLKLSNYLCQAGTHTIISLDSVQDSTSVSTL